MISLRFLGTTTALIFAFMLSSVSQATPVPYTDYSKFLAKLPGPADTLDFDSVAAGTTIADGGTLEGITFNYDFGGVQMKVSTGSDTTSPNNFLGTNDRDILQDGDNFSLSFAPSYAIGMYFITADDMFDDDIILSIVTGSVGLDASESQTLGDGSKAYFLGLIEDTVGFTTADVSTIGGGFFLYNVDDITTSPVPIPGSALLFGFGLVGMFYQRLSKVVDLAVLGLAAIGFNHRHMRHRQAC